MTFHILLDGQAQRDFEEIEHAEVSAVLHHSRGPSMLDGRLSSEITERNSRGCRAARRDAARPCPRQGHRSQAQGIGVLSHPCCSRCES